MAPFLTTVSLNALLQKHIDPNAEVDEGGHRCLLEKHCKVPPPPGAGQAGQGGAPPGPGGPPGGGAANQPGAPFSQQGPGAPAAQQPAAVNQVGQQGQVKIEPNDVDVDMTTGGGGEQDVGVSATEGGGENDPNNSLQTQLKQVKSQLKQVESDKDDLKQINKAVIRENHQTQAKLREEQTKNAQLTAQLASFDTQSAPVPTGESTLLESAWSLSVAAALVVYDGESVVITNGLPAFVNTDEGAACQGMQRSVACVVAKTIELFGKWGDRKPPDNGFPEDEYQRAWGKATDKTAVETLNAWLSPAVRRMLAGSNQYKTQETANNVITAFLTLVATQWASVIA